MIKFIDLFAGVGGIRIGAENALSKRNIDSRCVLSSEIDEKACQTYELNFDEYPSGDIHAIEEIEPFDLLLAGFPCQAFSVAGYRQGFNDEKGRGNLFFELARIIEEKKPQVVFLENVKNLVSHDNGNTFAVISETLEKLGYYIKPFVLNACSYGNIPQTRERIYIVCFRNKEHYKNFEHLKPIKLERTLADLIDFENKQDDKYYYTEKCDFYDKLVAGITKSDTCYQWRRVYVRENKSKMCPTLTANMGTGGHNVPLIRM